MHVRFLRDPSVGVLCGAVRGMRDVVSAAALCALAALCTAAAATSALSAPVVSTASGKVQGQSFGEYNRFLGSLALLVLFLLQL